MKKLIFLLWLTFTMLVAGHRRRRHARIGFLPDPPLPEHIKASTMYFDYNGFVHKFVDSRGLFQIDAEIPSNSTYIQLLSALATDPFPDRNELSAFLAHILFTSKGLTSYQSSLSMDSYVLSLNFNASTPMLSDGRSFSSPITWRLALWNWKSQLRTHGQNGTFLLRGNNADSQTIYEIYGIWLPFICPTCDKYKIPSETK